MYVFIIGGIIFAAYEYGSYVLELFLTHYFIDLVEAQIDDDANREYYEIRCYHRTISTETNAEWISSDEYNKMKQKVQQAELTARDLRKQLVDAATRRIKNGRHVETETETEWVSPDDHLKLKQKIQQAELAAMELRKQLVDVRSIHAQDAKAPCRSISTETDMEWISVEEYQNLQQKVQLLEKQLNNARETNERLGSTLTAIANGTISQSQSTPPASPQLKLTEEQNSSMIVPPPPPPPPPMPVFEIKPPVLAKKAKLPVSIVQAGQCSPMDNVIAELSAKKSKNVEPDVWNSPRSRRLKSPHCASPIKFKTPSKRTEAIIGAKTPTRGTSSKGTTPQKSTLPILHRRRDSHRITDLVSVQALTRHRLRKTNIPRSPGGTTLLPQAVKKRTALTWNDVAADAMRKKFAKAFPKDDVTSDGEWTDDEAAPAKTKLYRSKTIH